jgi:RimJ/RimL family protein N-acetyltransferase
MKLLTIRKKDYDDISKLVFNPKVMQNIGNGKVWNVEKLTNFIIYNIREQKLSHKEREHYYYRIVDNDKLIGVIGFYLTKGKWNLKVFINPRKQGKGYFKQSLKQLLKRLKEYKNVDLLYSQVHETNEKMNNIMLTKYYYDKSFNIGKIKINQYIIFNRPYTYLVKSDYITDESINNVFEMRKNWIKWDSSMSENPDFLHLDGVHYYDKRNQKYNVLLKNMMNNTKNPTIEKTALFIALTKKFRSSLIYLPKTYFYQKNGKYDLEMYKTLFDDNKPFIIKPDGGYAGSGIKVVNSFEDLKYIRKLKPEIWSFQEYLTNPVLIDDRKFHMRVLFIHRDDGEGFMFSQIPIYRAKKPFVLKNYNDNDIHISHYNIKDNELYLDDLQKDLDVRSIIKQIKIILNDVNSIINNSCYPETKNCYEMYGVDFMITVNDEQKQEVKLIEFNHKIGLKEFTDSCLPFNRLLLNAELNITADYYMPPGVKNPSFEDTSFISVSH